MSGRSSGLVALRSGPLEKIKKLQEQSGKIKATGASERLKGDLRSPVDITYHRCLDYRVHSTSGIVLFLPFEQNRDKKSSPSKINYR